MQAITFGIISFSIGDNAIGIIPMVWYPIERAALFHLNFEGVHPFVDGNGRAGRLIMNFMLMQCGYPPINVKFADRKRYYDCFDSYYRENNSVPMVDMVAEYLKERLNQYLNLLK